MRIAPLLILLVLLVAPVRPVQAQQGGLLAGVEGFVTRPSRYGVSDAMDRIEAFAKSEGAKVFARIDMADLSHKAGVKIRPNQLLIFDPGKLVGPLVDQAPMASLDLPFANALARRFAVDANSAAGRAANVALERILTLAMK